MHILNEIGKFFLSLTTHIASPQNSFPYQEDFLLKLIEKHKDTVYGKKYNFRSISSIYDFQKQVPITQYIDYKEYITQSMKGGTDILVKGKIDRFAKTAGTTAGESKYIPVTKESLKKNHYAGGQEGLARYCKEFSDSKVFEGKNIMMGGGFFPNPYTNEENIGYISAILQKNAPHISKRSRAVKEDICFLHDRNEKTYKFILETKDQNITNIGGGPNRILAFFEELCKYTHKDTIKQIRPDFELLFSGGISIQPYRSQLEKIVGGPFNTREIYNASEGFFAVQYKKNDTSMMLLTQHGVFLEFIPMATFHDAQPKVCTLQEVQKDIEYAIVITTTAGLYRYIIGDTVKFTSTDPFMIQITGRTRINISVFGENLIVDQAEVAISKTCDMLHCSISDYTVAPLFFHEGAQGAHERFIEFNKAPSDLRTFTKTLDEELKKTNSYYAGKRFQDVIIDIPIIHPLPKGTFHKRLNSKDKMGHQNKIPRLSNTRDFVEELQTYCK